MDDLGSQVLSLDGKFSHLTRNLFPSLLINDSIIYSGTILDFVDFSLGLVLGVAFELGLCFGVSLTISFTLGVLGMFSFDGVSDDLLVTEDLLSFSCLYSKSLMRSSPKLSATSQVFSFGSS